ncbi:MAG: NAD(P)/FAD-dependent oxidoreductase, partial [Novosphingobium sp.]|nr:NAD(P)/FAD-dependent oxidoreductase [Novosphingobium sp.]
MADTANVAPEPTLETAIAALDPVVALLALVQITGDRTLLHKYGPKLEGTQDLTRSAFVAVDGVLGHEEADDTVANEIRGLLMQEVKAGRHPIMPAIDKTLFREMARLALGLELPEKSLDPAYQHAGFATDTRIRVPEKVPPEDFKVLIVGAGMVGINAAIKLQQAGIAYQVIEAESNVGGTWLVNTYPGAAVDTESRIYSYSFEPNSSWTRYYPTGPEFLSYLNKVVDKYGVRGKIDFETRVSGAEWDENAAKWVLKAQNGGKDVTYEGNILIMATGPNNGPKYPDVKNMDAFKGRIVHTASWDKDLDVTGKKVVLVGAACSGVQVASALAGKAEKLTVVMRQPEYLIPDVRDDLRVDPLEIWAMENIPFVAQWMRLKGISSQMQDMRGMLTLDEEHRAKTGGFSPLNDAIRDNCRAYIERSFPDDPEMVALLTPDYPVFGKRPILDSCRYYEALKKPGVDLVKGELASFEEDAVVLSDGRRIECDIVILATGYQMYWGTQFDIKGRGGKTLREIFDPSPFSYWGMLIPGLPHFVLTVGPYSHLTATHAVLG